MSLPPDWSNRVPPKGLHPLDDLDTKSDGAPDRQAPDDPYAAQSPEELYSRAMGKPTADPTVGELKAIRMGGFLSLALLVVGLLIVLANPGVGFWELIEGVCFLGGGLALLGVFGFGLAATIRRQAWVPLVGGIVLTPIFYAFWAWYRLASGKN